MKETDLDRALERLFHTAFDLTAAQEQAMRLRILERRRQQGQEWAAFTRVMLGLKAHLQPGMDGLFKMQGFRVPGF